MIHYIVAIVVFMQPQMQTISVMQLPYPNVDECKKAIVQDGRMLQNDIMVMYPKADRFSLVCIDKKTVKDIVDQMKMSVTGKEI